MKKLLCVALLFASAVFGQWADFSSLTASSNLSNAMNAKPAARTGAGAPSGSCTSGKDWYLDTTGSILYYCVAAAWVRVPLQLAFTPLNPANNLSDLANAATARTNLGLGTAATQASSAFQAALGFTPLNVANNLSDLANAATARTNLGVFANPMTTAGDLIVGGTSGAPLRLAVPGNGTFCPSWSSGVLTFITCPGAGGGISSIGLTVPSWLTVTGSPLTANGTLPIAAATGQTAHQVIGTCGTATSFGPCALVAGDIPLLPQSGITGLVAALSGKVDSTSVGIASGVAPLASDAKVSDVYLHTVASMLGYTPADVAQVGALSGIAPLNSAGTVPLVNIPILTQAKIPTATIAQKFFGTTAPGSIAGNLPGDLYADTFNHHEYVCGAPSATSAPACTSVITGGWQQVDGSAVAASGKLLVTQTSSTINVAAGNAGFGAGGPVYAIPSTTTTIGGSTTGDVWVGIDAAGTVNFWHNLGASLTACPTTCPAATGFPNTDIIELAHCTVTAGVVDTGGCQDLRVDQTGSGRTIFTGAGVSEARAAGVRTITIPGGSGSSGVTYCAPASASGTAYTCTPSPALASYAAGVTLAFVPDLAATGGATTVNVSGLGAKSVKMADGTTDPPANIWVVSSVNVLTYDGTVFRIADKYDSTKSGGAYFQGVTSGGVALAAANIAGTAIAYVLPSTNGTANQVLTDSGSTTCPTLPTGFPSTCHLLAWATLTSSSVGLGSVNNTSDAAKPISTATQTALDLKAPLASPTFTGTPAAPTAAVDTNTTQAATTAFVVAQAASATPIVDGSAAVGTSTRFARADHVHPTDTTRSALASPTFTGTPAAPTAAVDTNTTQLATTAFVIAQAASANPVIDGTAAPGTSTRYARADHVHPTDTTRSKVLTLPFGCAVGDPAGSALATGVLCYITVPTAGTIIGWDIIVDAGTATVDVFKIATGTAKPTASIAASALPAISTGTAIHSTTLTGWTTSVAANDMLGFNLTTVATAKYITVNVQVQF